jgi:hypothetical protein
MSPALKSCSINGYLTKNRTAAVEEQATLKNDKAMVWQDWLIVTVASLIWYFQLVSCDGSLQSNDFLG